MNFSHSESFSLLLRFFSHHLCELIDPEISQLSAVALEGAGGNPDSLSVSFLCVFVNLLFLLFSGLIFSDPKPQLLRPTSKSPQFRLSLSYSSHCLFTSMFPSNPFFFLSFLAFPSLCVLHPTSFPLLPLDPSPLGSCAPRFVAHLREGV